jgi:hypothetical protein
MVLVFFVAMIHTYADAARSCSAPSKPSLSLEKLGALGKRAAYASFLSDECGFGGDIHKKHADLIRIIYPDSTAQQQKFTDDFKLRKRNFSQDASFLGIKKRCLIEANKTRAFVNEAGDDVSAFSQVVLSDRETYTKLESEFDSCKALQAAEIVVEKKDAARIEYERSEEFARKKVVVELERSFRASYMESKSGTYVLKLRNPGNRTAEFLLKCVTASGSAKSFRMVIASGDSTELGFLEGWPGNFTSGQMCYAYYNEYEVWTYGLK